MAGLAGGGARRRKSFRRKLAQIDSVGSQVKQAVGKAAGVKVGSAAGATVIQRGPCSVLVRKLGKDSTRGPEGRFDVAYICNVAGRRLTDGDLFANPKIASKAAAKFIKAAPRKSYGAK
jgi:hypothetical protein